MSGKRATAIAATLLTEFLAFLPTSVACAQPPQLSAPDQQVIEFGNEQAIVDAIAKRSELPTEQNYPNDLDRVLFALSTRACPKPNVHKLIQNAIDAMSTQGEQSAQNKIPATQRNAWVSSVEQSMSFEPVLAELVKDRTATTKQQLVDSGLTAMLEVTGSKAAGVLSASQSESLANMLNARNAPEKEHRTLGIDASNWPTIKVLPDFPAADAGLHNGDIVLRVNEHEVAKSESAAEGLKTLKAASSGIVKLTIERNGEIMTVGVTGASAADRVKARVIDPDVVYIQIPSFEGSGIAQRVKELIHQHSAKPRFGIILDLRNNVGGRAEEANGVADIFLDDKILETFQFRDGKRITFKSKPGGLKNAVVVLMDHDTASAAEMLAMALHDNHRAVLVGQPTAGLVYGKDFEKLSDGRIVCFRTEPTILSPTGNDYSEVGLISDVAVEIGKDSSVDAVLVRALQEVRESSNSKPVE